MANALKERAQAVLNDTSIEPQSRAMIRYAMEINDPWLAELVRQADTDGTIDLSEIPLGSEKICRSGEGPVIWNTYNDLNAPTI